MNFNKENAENKIYSFYIFISFFFLGPNYFFQTILASLFLLGVVLLKLKKIYLNFFFENKSNIVQLLILLVLFTFFILQNKYGYKYTIQQYIYIGFIIILGKINYKIKINKQKINRNNIILLCFFLGQIIFHYINYKRGVYNSYYGTIIKEKNIASIYIILFYMYCYKIKFKLGVLVSLLSLIPYQSRGALLVIIIFQFLVIFEQKIKKNYNKIKKINFFILLNILLILLIFFSLYWIKVISVDNLKEYKQGLNDKSNQMRFKSNLIALKEIKEKKLYFYGLDDKTLIEIGANPEMPLHKHKKIDGIRVVQPHNSILNLYLKIGLIPGIFYLILLNKIIKSNMSYSNIKYIFPYLLNSFFMHGFLTGPFLIFWIYILKIPNVKEKSKIKITLRRNIYEK